MTYILIFITVIVSIACFRSRALFDKLSLRPYRIAHNKEWYRVISHGFVHADYIHLAVNMFVLFSFGEYMEQLFKSYAQAGTIANAYLSIALLYFGGMIAASVYDVFKRRNDPHYASIGASGAVSAVVFAFIFFNPWEKIYFFGIVPIPAIVFALLYAVYSQYMGRRQGDNINHFAHLFGGLFGFVFPLLIDPAFFPQFIHNITHP